MWVATLYLIQRCRSPRCITGRNPKRDNINALVTYLRQPMVYDGTEETLVCRQVSESWLPTPMVENIAAFILRAAEIAPGWGTETFKISRDSLMP